MFRKGVEIRQFSQIFQLVSSLCEIFLLSRFDQKILNFHFPVFSSNFWNFPNTLKILSHVFEINFPTKSFLFQFFTKFLSEMFSRFFKKNFLILQSKKHSFIKFKLFGIPWPFETPIVRSKWQFAVVRTSTCKRKSFFINKALFWCYRNSPQEARQNTDRERKS